jgi:hypothetical protein
VHPATVFASRGLSAATLASDCVVVILIQLDASQLCVLLVGKLDILERTVISQQQY